MNTQLRAANAGQTKKQRIFLILALGIAFLLASGASNAFARPGPGGWQGASSGGYAGPGPDLVTVEQAKNMPDDAHVALKGHIIQSLGGKDYVFKDATGTITVEISGKRWQGQNIGPEDLVEIHGEVDKDWTSVEIDVKRIIKL